FMAEIGRALSLLPSALFLAAFLATVSSLGFPRRGISHRFSSLGFAVALRRRDVACPSSRRANSMPFCRQTFVQTRAGPGTAPDRGAVRPHSAVGNRCG